MRTINLNIPTNWIELSNAQLKFVSKLFLSEWAQVKFKFLTHALVCFSGLKIKNKKAIKSDGQLKYFSKIKREKVFALSPGQVRSAAGKLEWLTETVQEVKPLKKIGFAKPCNYRLYKTTFNQFLTAENFYTAYQQTNKVEYLNCLVATLYKMPWQKFNEDLVKKRSRHFKLSRLHIKYTVFLWYSGFRWYVSQQCPNIFSKGGSGESVKIKDHILGMVRGLTDGDVTKNDAVQQVETWEALYELDAKAKHIHEMTEKLKSK